MELAVVKGRVEKVTFLYGLIFINAHYTLLCYFPAMRGCEIQ